MIIQTEFFGQSVAVVDYAMFRNELLARKNIAVSLNECFITKINFAWKSNNSKLILAFSQPIQTTIEQLLFGQPFSARPAAFTVSQKHPPA